MDKNCITMAQAINGPSNEPKWRMVQPLAPYGGYYYECPVCLSRWSMATNETNRFECCPKCGTALKKARE